MYASAACTKQATASRKALITTSGVAWCFVFSGVAVNLSHVVVAWCGVVRRELTSRKGNARRPKTKDILRLGSPKDRRSYRHTWTIHTSRGVSRFESGAAGTDGRGVNPTVSTRKTEACLGFTLRAASNGAFFLARLSISAFRTPSYIGRSFASPFAPAPATKTPGKKQADVPHTQNRCGTHSSLCGSNHVTVYAAIRVERVLSLS